MPSDFAVAVVCDTANPMARSRVRDGVEAAARERVFETDEHLSCSVDFVRDEPGLLERVSSVLDDTHPRRLIAISDKLALPGELHYEPSEVTKRIRDLVFPTKHLCGLVALVPGTRRRIRDIDRVLDANQLAHDLVRDAIAKTASALWLKSPPRVRTTPGPGQAIRVQLVRSEGQLKACLQLRYHVYDVMGYLEDEVSASPSKIELDWFDLQSLHFAAVDHATGGLAGTMRLVLAQIPAFMSESVVGRPDRARETHRAWCRAIAAAELDPVLRRRLNSGYFLPLPILQSTDFRDRWPDVLGEANEGAEVSRVVVAPPYRGAGISRLLVRTAIATAYDLRKRYLMLECIPAHEAMYAKYGFARLEGYHTRATELDQVAVGMRLELDDRPDNSAVALAKRDREMIRCGSAGSRLLSESAHLCLCQNTMCWTNAQYQFRTHSSCPLQRLHRR